MPADEPQSVPANDSLPVGHDKENEISQEKQEVLRVEVADEVEKPDPELWYTQEEADRAIRKLDWRLMPLIFILYSLCVLDRSNLGNAKLAGLQKAIDLSGNRYNWLATAFYIAYILFQPIMVGWKLVPSHIWVSSAVFLWGIVSTLQATITSWGGLMTCRVFLGITECMFSPGVPLYLSFFYSREKLGFRVGIFTAGSALANAYGGALAYGISQAKSSVIGPWQILFIVEGVPTCLLGILAFFWFPTSPRDESFRMRFLNERERKICIDLAEQQPGDRESRGLTARQVFQALLDYRSYLPGLCYFGINVCFASLPLFVPTIINDMGAFTSIQSQGLSAPPYLLCFFAILAVTWISDHVGFRGPFIAGFGLIAAVGYIILGTATGTAVRYFALFLSALIFVCVPQTNVWVANTHATDSKRAGAMAICAAFGQCGPLLGTAVFTANTAPYYREGMWVSCGACFLVFSTATIQSILLMLENRRLDKKYGKVEKTRLSLNVHSHNGMDPQFRYII